MEAEIDKMLKLLQPDFSTLKKVTESQEGQKQVLPGSDILFSRRNHRTAEKQGFQRH